MFVSANKKHEINTRHHTSKEEKKLQIIYNILKKIHFLSHTPFVVFVVVVTDILPTSVLRTPPSSYFPRNVDDFCETI